MKSAIVLLALLLPMVALSQSDPCHQAHQTRAACDADHTTGGGCTWCACKALPSACWTIANSKRLPPSVYVCDAPAQPAAKAIPDFAEQFSMSSVEIDDTAGGRVVLKQTIAIDPINRREYMNANGDLASGHLEQVTHCESTPGYLLQITGTGSSSKCLNDTDINIDWTNFWDFPANASSGYIGQITLPQSNSTQVFDSWKYWQQSEQWQLFASGATPVWFGRIVAQAPATRFHFEYSNFVAGPPPLSAFNPHIPAGVQCTPVKPSSSPRRFSAHRSLAKQQ